jgi:hypothetical protein
MMHDIILRIWGLVTYHLEGLETILKPPFQRCVLHISKNLTLQSQNKTKQNKNKNL